MNKHDLSQEDLFSNVHYVCAMTNVIKDALQKGCDIVNFPNGDLMVSQMKMVHVKYRWDPVKKRLLQSAKY